MHRTPAALCFVALACVAPDLQPVPDDGGAPHIRVDAALVDGGGAKPGGRDGGTDAGSPADGGRDAGSAGDDDAGSNAGSDAGSGAGRDAGSDGSRDAGSPRDAGSDAGRDGGSPAPDAGGGMPADRSPVLGVTITDPWVAGSSAGAALRDELRALAGPGGRKPMARVVFDEGVDRVFRTYGIDASAYVDPVRAIGADARVMGELLDSFYVPDYDLAQTRARACEYRATLGHLVDVWEVGNEVNGEWLGAGALEKIAAAVEIFRADAASFARLCPGFSLRRDERPFELALTLYQNGEHAGGRATSNNCWERPDHAMLHWAARQFGSGGAAASWRDALDYVWVSYYEDDCEGVQPRWQEVFDELGRLFPRASLGIGECGTTVAARKRRYAERYYHGMDSSDPAFANMRVSHPRFVGGFFWWYFSDDVDEPAVTETLRAAVSRPFWSR